MPPRPFGALFSAQVKSLDVHVALVHESEQAPNVDLDGRAGGALRYLREQATVVDSNTGAGSTRSRAPGVSPPDPLR